MNNRAQLEYINSELLRANLNILTKENVLLINDIATEMLNRKNHDSISISMMGTIISISNILYNNTDRELLPLEDGVYDLLLILYKRYNPNYKVGAEPVNFDMSNGTSILNDTGTINPIKYIEPLEDPMFMEDLTRAHRITREDTIVTPYHYAVDISRRTIDTPHVYPELVGTLDKCKFVLSRQAIDRGVFEDNNVTIFERDFIYKHLQMGIIKPDERFKMILELKYDGVSVEAEVSDRVLSARSRGDTANDIATDLTPILGGYKFRHAESIPHDEVFGMKFEAIINIFNLRKLGELRGTEYKNCRNAVTGVFGSTDGYLYRDLITLVPLATSLNIDRQTEVEFMNKYYSTGENLRYAIIEGTYIEILFQVKRFVEEAEYMRSFLPFMYDGVVVSYLDEDKRKKLGRQNSVNLYSMAIKFDAMKKMTVFTGYDYTVGQNGVITPMIHYNPVEFYGTIHNKSSGHSYRRFNELNLAIGDVICVEYTNDVMPYVTKPDNSANANNPNPPIPFVDRCPSCGGKIRISKSGKSAICDNMACPERVLTRMVNMMQKLNLKDFSEESLKLVARYSLSEILNLTREDVIILGDMNSQKFIDRMTELKTMPIEDYKIVGSIGFTGIAIGKWKLILNKMPLRDIINMEDDRLEYKLKSIKGIGPNTSNIILMEREFFVDDIKTIMSMPNVICTLGAKSSGRVIRFTGFRDAELAKKLVDLGHDCDMKGGLTNKTDILLVPTAGFRSVKTSKAKPNTIIVPVDEFKANMDKYL